MATALALTVAWQPAAANTLAVQLPGDPAFAMLIPAEQALLVLTNADRAANGLAPLEFDPDTLEIARQRAASQIDMPSLSHYNSDGSLAFVNLLANAQLTYAVAGENLARAYGNDVDVTSRVEVALMASPTHRKNILDHSFNRLAVGVATDGAGQINFAEVYRS
jgi:uncharacterized protein YkwD